MRISDWSSDVCSSDLRRLSSLRADREAVDAVVERMNEATRRADAALKGIRQTAEQAKTTLDEPTVRAQALCDELSFLVQRADAAGERLAEIGRADVCTPDTNSPIGLRLLLATKK